MRYGHELQIYLAGKMSGLKLEEMNQWRQNVKCGLLYLADSRNCNIRVINPIDYYNYEYPNHKNEKEIMFFDLSRVKKSDVILVNIDGLNTSIGTCIELYEAYRCEIPVIAFGDDKIYQNLHPWIKECITRTENNYGDACNYISDYYMT